MNSTAVSVCVCGWFCRVCAFTALEHASRSELPYLDSVLEFEGLVVF